jgi:hypothetical protein
MANYAYLINLGREDVKKLESELNGMTDSQLRKVSSFFNLHVKSRNKIISEVIDLIRFLTHKDKV